MGLRKLWKSWRIHGCVDALANCEQALAQARGWLVDHEARRELYMQNPLMGEAQWRSRYAEVQDMEAHWVRRVQEWKATEETTKRAYVVLAVSLLVALGGIGGTIFSRVAC